MADMLTGGSGNDTIDSSGTFAAENFVDGGSGNDTIKGGGGRDHIFGGTGDDTLTGGSKTDIFYFDENHGHDVITDFNTGSEIPSHADRIDLSAFNPPITWAQLQDAMQVVTEGTQDFVRIDLTDFGGGTIDLHGISSVSELTRDLFILEESEAATSVIHGTLEGDTLEGTAGADKIMGMEGDDILRGGEGRDWILGGEGDDEIHGGEGVDSLHGGEGDDTIYGDGGTDFLHGGDGIDTIEGGDGNDYIYGDGGNDKLYGQEGRDLLIGDAGNDELYGGAGNDSLRGASGDDTLEGGAGNDILMGGAGADTFVYGVGDGNDRIVDFTNDEDEIDLSAFTGLTFNDLVVNQVGSHVQIDLSEQGGGTITLFNLNANDLDQSDFIFDTTVDGM